MAETGARPLAVVTGPTAGIGAAFARALAGEGHDLVLVARDAARLQETADELTERYGVRCRVLAADLATDDGTAAVAAVLRDEPVRVLVNNAGFGIYGRFAENDLADELRMLDLDVRSVLVLSHAAVGAMTARGGGDIVNVSSVGGFVPRASGASYVGAKAWVTGFTEALAQQLDGTGVRVCAVCPGYTRTEFHQRADADMSHVPGWMWLDADQVVAEGLADLRRGRPVSVPTLRYKSLLAAVKLLPRPTVRKAMGSSSASPDSVEAVTDLAADRAALLELIREIAVVHGRVTLSSGREADFYVDLRRITLHHRAAPLVGRVMNDLVAGWDAVAAGGLTLGADPVAAAMLHASGGAIDAFVVRKEGKAHGLQRRVEGPDVAGRRVVAVEDTSTTGSSVLAAVEALREAGADVAGCAVIVDRGAGAAVEAAGYEYRAAFTMADLGL